jgi:2'-5' RNA ligase
MPKTTRTFVALALPATSGAKLTRLQSLLEPQVPAARWTRTEPFHLTLAFLGDVDDTDLHKVCKAVAQAAAPFPQFELQVESIGAFPSATRPRVLWAGLTAANDSPLFPLQRAIVRQMTAVGYRPDDARFTPHVTLGRIKSDRRGPQPPDLTSILEPYQTWSGGTFAVTEVVTFASTLTPEGPVYAPLARAALAGGKNAPSP